MGFNAVGNELLRMLTTVFLRAAEFKASDVVLATGHCRQLAMFVK